MISELDMDDYTHMNIDEFIVFLTKGDLIPFKHDRNWNTYTKIKSACKANPIKFLNSLKRMPTNFVPSFTRHLWSDLN